MPNQSGKIVLVLILLLFILGAVIYFQRKELVHFFLPGFKKDYSEQVPNYSVQTSDRLNEVSKSSDLSKKYSSADLKISFSYPGGWFVSDKDFDLMISSFPTKFGANAQPDKDQIKFFINNFNGCHETIDENLKDPACGEGGPNVKPNEIISKETQDINGAKFYKYLIKYPDGKKQTFYFLEKGDRVLQIDKTPDPSVFEKEFDEIIKSIKFNS